MEIQGIWKEKRQIYATHVDGSKKAGIIPLISFLQEIAGHHATFRKLGYFDMKEHGQYWVLHLLRVEIERYPEWREELELQTWVREMKGPFSYRDFRFTDAEGNVILNAGTLWISMDKEKGKPVRLGERGNSLPLHPEKMALKGKLEKLPSVEATNTPLEYRARYMDTDMLGHVNNVRYVAWALDTYPDEQWLNFQPEILEVQYMSETQMGENVKRFTKPSESHTFLHSHQSNERELCRLRIHWQERR